MIRLKKAQTFAKWMVSQCETDDLRGFCFGERTSHQSEIADQKQSTWHQGGSGQKLQEALAIIYAHYSARLVLPYIQVLSDIERGACL
ncbi:hypothetical protein D3C84_1185990 [compost metagenome]